MKVRALFVLYVLSVATVATASATAQRPPSRPVRSTPSHATRPTIPAGYAGIVRAWHTPTPGKKAPVDNTGRPMLVLHAMYVDETITLAAASDRGGFAASDLDRAAHALREPATGNEHPVEPGTVDVLY